MIKSVVAAVHVVAGMYILFGRQFGWYDLGGFGADSAVIVAFILLGVGNILTFMPKGVK